MIIKEFVHEKFGALRSTSVDGKIYFCGADVYKALGLTYHIMDRIREEEKVPAMFVMTGTGRKGAGVTLGGLFYMVMSSRKQGTQEFKDWVCYTVLPSIYENGGYIEGQESLPADERTELEAKIKALSAEVAKANAGKAKLAEYLMEEEDRSSKITAWNAACQAKLYNAQDELTFLKRRFSDPVQVERYLAALRSLRELDARKEEFMAVERRIPYAKPEIVEADPLVITPDCSVMRRSELLASMAG